MLHKTLLALLPFLLLLPSQDRQREASLSLIARDYAKAIDLLGQELREREADRSRALEKRADRVLFLLAGAKLRSGDLAGAEADFRRLGADYPDSELAFLGRYGLADTLSRQRGFQAAAEIYRKEVARLLSPERRVRLSETYLGLVDKRLAKDPPDSKGALSFLDLAIGLELPRRKAHELGMRAARVAFDAKDYAQAARRFEALVVGLRGAVFGDGRSRRDPAWDDRLWLARAWRRTGNVQGARRLLEDLLREGIPGEGGPNALFELALCYGVPNDRTGAARGIDVLERFLAEHGEHAKAPEAAYLLATTQGRSGRLADALQTLDLMLERYADTKGDQLAQAAADRGVYLGRLGRHDDAIAAWKAYLSRFPAHGRWMDAQRAIVDLELARAGALRKQGKEHYDAAAELYRAFLGAHPLDARTRGIYLTLGSMDEERERYDEAKRTYERCAAKYPRTREASEAGYRIGRLLESKLFDYVAALAAYRKVKGPFRGQAARRIRVLEEKSLTLRTERVFRTDEKPHVEVVSRNIPKLRVRVYKLDIETFFRGTLGSGSIESLAVEVISPDKSFESGVAGYVAHKETERQVEIPFAGAGAYVVKVDDSEFEATTLVLVSDLALITKSSRKQLFVFAENTRENRAEPGARVFVTDGRRVVAEGVTDGRGAYRFAGAGIEDAQRLHVFARTGGGSAATTLDLAGLALGQGLVPKAFVYTDRSVYKPGETCGVKAILRDVDAGVYTLPAHRGYDVDWIDGHGRVLASRPVALTPFGTVQASFEVPAQASPGAFSLRLRRHDDGRVLATQAVRVAEFRAPRISLAIDTERRVLVRGEKIEGKVVARYFFGGPVRGKKVEVQARIGGRRLLAGKTDEAGEFAFSFETSSLTSGAEVVVQVAMPAEQAVQAETFRIRDTEFRVSLTTPSRVYVAGDDLEAEVAVRSHDDRPLARKVRVELYRLATTKGGVQELPVASREVTTDPKTGRGYARFAVAAGGKHRLRAFAKDRLGNRIEVHHDLFVSGKDDEVKLRVLSAVQHGKVGDEVVLRVLNRVGPKLCLVTTEGDGVLAFATRVFPKGETRVDLELGELHAPNFAWALTMVDGRHLYEARKDFLVERPLRVEVRPAARRLSPGGKLALEIVATDSRGRPAEGEFSVAVVDRSILDLFPDKSPTLSEVFYGPEVRRVTGLRTASSSTFRYGGTTRRVNRELEAEEQRRAREKAEEEARRALRTESDGFTLGRGLHREAQRPAAAADKAQQEALDEEAVHDIIGIGGGAGGKFGGRFGGRRQRRSRSKDGRLAAGPQNLLHLEAAPQLDVLFGQQAVQAGGAFGLSNENLRQDEPAPAEGGRVRSLLAAAAVWRAVVTTGPDGRAGVEVDMPGRDGAWNIRVRGITRSSLVGEGTSSVVTAKDLLVKPQMPAVLTEGDRPKGRVAIHNLAPSAVDVTWGVEHDGGKAGGKARIAGKGLVERAFPYRADRVGRHELRCTAARDGAKDEVVLRVDVQPWSIEERSARSGLLAGAETVRLRLPAGHDYRSRSLVVELGPEVAGELLPSGPVIRRSRLSCNFPRWVPPTHANRAASGLAALALYAHWAAASPGDAAALARLRARIEGTIAALQSLEAGGEIRWIGKRGKGSPDARSTLLAGRFLVRARNAGFVVDEGVMKRMRGKLATYLRAREADVATLAFLVSAEDGRADFTRFNTLYRARQRLGSRAKGQLALAAFAMARPGLATELVAAIATELRTTFAPGRPSVHDKRDLIMVEESPVEAVLWGLLALSRAKGFGDVVRAGEKWVWSKRRPWGWSNALVTALAVEFLTGRGVTAGKVAGRVEVGVNGKFHETVDFRTDRSHRRIVVPAAAIAAGENRITLRTSGRGKVVWSVLLAGMTRGLPEDRVGSRYLERTYLQAPPVLDGAVLPEGFSSVGAKVERWKNEAKEVAVGGSLRVRLRYTPPVRVRASVGSFVLEEPLPAGTLVLPSEVSGSYDHMEVGPGFLRFFVHSSRPRLDAAYTLRGVVAGHYRVLPARVYSLDHPAVSVYGAAAAIDVLDAGKTASDEHRATPDEMYARGIRLFDRLSADQLASDAAARGEAERWLDALYREFGDRLRDRQFREVARRLLRVSLAEGDHGRTVRVFEALKDRDENWVLGFDDMAKVGRAYYATGEFERALVVYQAIAETSFLKEVQIAGTLDRIGEIKASIDFMRTLFLSFPGVPTVRGAIYGLAQSLNRKARELEASHRFDPKVGTPLELKRIARNLCYEFLLRHPDDADADEVTFTLASVALEAGQRGEAIELLGRARKAYPGSAWLDDFLYLEGYAHFLQGDYDDALALLARVAEGDFPVGGGRKGKSESRWLATFLRGQIYHAAGKPGAALAEYAKVEKRFADAREAADYFRRKRLALDEVTLVHPGEKSRVKLAYRNLGEVDLTVYKVDLMRLYLMRKSLSDMGNVQLFGIAPIHERKMKLDTGEDWTDHEIDVDLPAEAAGAYLVLARSGELKSSGLLLRTDLAIEAQELAGERRIRVNVKRGGRFLAKATVKVVGDRDGRIRTGRTDLRGIFVADGLRGRATVLAEAGGSYAFYRSKTSFGPPAPARKKAKSNTGKPGAQFDALRQNSLRNFKLQEQREKELKSLYGNRQKGVEIRRAK